MKIRQERFGTLPDRTSCLASTITPLRKKTVLWPNNSGEMLCPNVAKLAQEKNFAVGEGVVIQ
jgi:hypothetical protein